MAVPEKPEQPEIKHDHPDSDPDHLPDEFSESAEHVADQALVHIPTSALRSRPVVSNTLSCARYGGTRVLQWLHIRSINPARMTRTSRV